MTGTRDTPMTEGSRARWAVLTVFLVAGWHLASWLPRMPDLRDKFGLSSQAIGLVLLAVSAGAVLGLPLSGAICHRFGPARSVLIHCIIASIGLTAIGIAPAVPVLVVGLFLVGFGAGIWDVGMNLEGAMVERRLGMAIMPHFHAAFSIGTVLGALTSALVMAAGVCTDLHLGAVAGCGWLAVARAQREFLPWHRALNAPASGSWRAWREPRTLAIGLLVLAFSFTEGTANEWLALAFVDGYRLPNFAGALGFAGFVTAMTVSRVLGPRLLHRFGRVRVLRVSAACAAGGVLLVSQSGGLVGAGAGAILWGLGAALGFPVGMSAAADDPARAPARVSAVASIGYSAYLVGPPLLGSLAQSHGVRSALLVVLGLLVVAFGLAGAARPIARPN